MSVNSIDMLLYLLYTAVIEYHEIRAFQLKPILKIFFATSF